MQGKFYAKFLILGYPRVGTQWLRSLFHSHPQIKAFSECFNLKELSENKLIDALQNPVQYLIDTVFKPYPDKIRAVGFSLLYYQMNKDWSYEHTQILEYGALALRERVKHLERILEQRCASFDLLEHLRSGALWAYLKNTPELKVIHLKRRNKLGTILSLRLANLSDQWKQKRGNFADQCKQLLRKIVYDKRKINLDYDECVSVFRHIQKWEEEYDYFFQSHNKLEVYYEDLCQNPRYILERIQDFLGIERQELHSSLLKQNRKPLRKSIANYRDLKGRFKNSEWEKFFEE